ncbi:MAG: hypothetical protein OEV01_12755 [Nitrospira sp.]|nr:hypothetical protein [Nitrospira sp.]MDH4304553.1 hypothetical protein [Nitrospira sp.]MDH5193109.1 hypothetical protein [Nitrospira sp.]
MLCRVNGSNAVGRGFRLVAIGLSHLGPIRWIRFESSGENSPPVAMRSTFLASPLLTQARNRLVLHDQHHTDASRARSERDQFPDEPKGAAAIRMSSTVWPGIVIGRESSGVVVLPVCLTREPPQRWVMA